MDKAEVSLSFHDIPPPNGPESTYCPSPVHSAMTSGTAFCGPVSKHVSGNQPAPFKHSLGFFKSFKGAPSSTTNADSEAQLLFLGYKQELSRTWDFWAASSISFCDMAPLVACFVSLGNSLVMGGPVIMTWGFLTSGIMTICMISIFAEISSAFPVAGAMVSWSFKLARGNPKIRGWARPVSWVIASSLCAAHILVHAMMAREFSNILMQVFISSGYDLHLTDSKRIAIGFLYIAFCGCLAMTPLAHSAKFWKFAGIIMLALNISFCLAVLITSKHWRPFHTLFTRVVNHSQVPLPNAWVLIFTWCRVSIVMTSEPAAHLAEETKNAASAIPRAMFWSNVFSFVVLLFSSVCLTLALPPVLHPPRPTSPLTSVLFVLCPLRVAQFAIGSLLITSTMMDTAQFVGTSRFFWAMARDKAIPYAKFWRKVNPSRRPIRSLWLMLFVTLAIFSTIFEPSHVMLKVIADSASYMIVLVYLSTLLLYLMSEKDVLVRDGRNVWTLGRLSRPLAFVVTVWLLFVFVVILIPERLRINSQEWTWSPVTIPGIIGLSLLSWLLYGRSHYVGPVKSMTVWTIGQEVEIPKKIHEAVQLPKPSTTILDRNGTKVLGTEEVHDRSTARMTRAGETTRNLDCPQTYRTYDSTGSMWTQSHGPGQ